MSGQLMSIFGFAFSVLAAIGTAFSIWRSWNDRSDRNELRLVSTVTESDKFRDRVVEIVISHDRIEAKMDGVARAVVFEELPDNETVAALRKGVETLQKNVESLQGIFMHAGVQRMLSGSYENKPMDQIPIRKS